MALAIIPFLLELEPAKKICFFVKWAFWQGFMGPKRFFGDKKG
jgi:hypothetical protein